MKIASWVGSLAATVVVSLPFMTTVGCSTGRLSVEGDGLIEVPFAPDIKYDFRFGVGGDTEVVGEGGPAYAKRCFLLTVFSEDDSVLGQFVIEADSHGAFAQALPDGAHSIAAVVIDCDEAAEILKKQGAPPKHDEEDEDSREDDEVEGEEQPVVDELNLHPSLAVVSTTSSVPVWTNYVFHGGTVTPDYALGGHNTRFAVSALARDVEEALSMVQPILTHGIGADVPPLVSVHLYTHVSLDLMGVRIRAASTSQIEELVLDVNHGAHRADLGARREVVQSNVNAWSVVESTMPLTDLIVSTLPWEEFSNHGSVNVRLAGMREFVHADLTLTHIPVR